MADPRSNQSVRRAGSRVLDDADTRGERAHDELAGSIRTARENASADTTVAKGERLDRRVIGLPSAHTGFVGEFDDPPAPPAFDERGPPCSHRLPGTHAC